MIQKSAKTAAWLTARQHIPLNAHAKKWHYNSQITTSVHHISIKDCNTNHRQCRLFTKREKSQTPFFATRLTFCKLGTQDASWAADFQASLEEQDTLLPLSNTLN